MLKPFLEMYEIDVAPYCEYREAKDENGKKLKIPYLPWEACLILLRQNGVEKLKYRPLLAPGGGYVFCGDEVVSQKKIYGKNGEVSWEERKTRCYFVTVEMEIEGEIYTMAYPIMNGTAVVYEDTLNQLRVNNAIQRAFVKCVAVNTGLGIKLWEKDGETPETDNRLEAVTPQTAENVKGTIERIVTTKIRNGMSENDLFSVLGINKKTFDMILKGLQGASWLLGALNRL